MKKKKHRSGRLARRGAGRVRTPTPSSVAAQEAVDLAGATLEKLLIAAVEPLHYDVVEFRLDGRRHIRITIDKIPDSGKTTIPYRSGIRMEDCQLVSRAVISLLTEQGRDPGGFQIEVNSPGLDRPLTRTEHFARFTGQQITVTLRESRVDGRKNFTGTLVSADEESVVVHVLDHDSPESFARNGIRHVKLRPSFDIHELLGQRKSKNRRKKGGKHKRR